MSEQTQAEMDDLLIADSYSIGQASDVEIAQLRDLAAYMEKLEDFIKRAETAIKERKKELKELSETTLPAKMAQLGIPGIDISGTRRVEIQNIIAAKMPSKDQPDLYARAVKKLDELDLGDIVKREVVALMGKDSEEQTQRLIEEMKRATNGQVAILERTDVNYQTLNATLKEQQRKGLPLPSVEDGFDIYVGPRAKLIRAK